MLWAALLLQSWDMVCTPDAAVQLIIVLCLLHSFR